MGRSLHTRRPRIAASLAALGGLALLAAQAQAAAPGPWEVVGYAKAEGEGPSKTWSLDADQPFLAVPYVGDELDGAVVRIAIGSEVGAALFQKPFFGSRDRTCAPIVGSEARPELRWLGATARFEPGADGMPPDALAAPDEATGGYGSLILFRKDLGPPPGALLLHRRRTLGMMCPSPVHKIFYDRLFVPIAAGGADSRCVDLAREVAVPDSKKKLTVRFAAAERLVLLLPADLSQRYRADRHRLTVTVYDELGCTGQSVSFRSGARGQTATQLDDFGFRQRARSLRLTYERGPLLAFLSAPEALAPSDPAPAAPAPRQAVTQEPAAQAQAAAPVRADTAAEPVRSEAPGEPIRTEAAAEPAVSAPASMPAAEPDRPETAQPAAAAERIETAVERPEAAAAPNPTEARIAQPAHAAAPKPTQTGVAQTEPAAAPERIETEVEPPAASIEAEPKPEPRALQQAMPKLEPVLVPETKASPAVASQTFAFPVHDIYRLNYCLGWERDCGEPAARTWCRAQGFARASDWRIDENIGALFPTIVLSENRVCAQFVCDGFREITCAN